MEQYLEDSSLSKCLLALNETNIKKCMSVEEMMDFDLEVALHKIEHFQSNSQIKKKTRAIWTLNFVIGWKKIRNAKCDILIERSKMFLKKCKKNKDDFNKDISPEDEYNANVNELLKSPVLKLAFPELPVDENLLDEDESFYPQSNKSERSEDVDLEQMSLSFQNFFHAPQGDDVPEDEIRVGHRRGTGDRLVSIIEEEIVPSITEEDSQIVPETPTKRPGSIAPGENIGEESQTVPGTPTKRPGSTARGEETPSKRRKLLSLGTQENVEDSIQQNIPLVDEQGLEPSPVEKNVNQAEDRELDILPIEENVPDVPLADEQRPEQLPVEENVQQVEEPTLDPLPAEEGVPQLNIQRGRRKIIDKRTQQTQHWLNGFSNRTNSYQRTVNYDRLELGITSDLVSSKTVLRNLGFSSEDENINSIFEAVIYSKDHFMDESTLGSEIVDEPRRAEEVESIDKERETTMVPPNVDDTGSQRETTGSRMTLGQFDRTDHSSSMHSPQPPGISTHEITEQDTVKENIPAEENEPDYSVQPGHVIDIPENEPDHSVPARHEINIPENVPDHSVSARHEIDIPENVPDHSVSARIEDDISREGRPAEQEQFSQINEPENQLAGVEQLGEQYEYSENMELDTSNLSVTEEDVWTKILDLFSSEQGDFFDLEKIIPLATNNKESATIYFHYLLELQKKKKIVMSQDRHGGSIYVRKYSTTT